MVETGVVNILGTRRTDTPYNPNDPLIRAKTYCQILPCIEVKLQLSSYRTQSTGTGIALTEVLFGTESAAPNYGGYVITEGSTYPPQMPWYMAHYCDQPFPGNVDVQDPVCYADYFSPMNSGFNAYGQGGRNGWPNTVPWSVSPATSINHCAPKLPTCTLVMAGFPLSPVPKNQILLFNDPFYGKYNNFLFQWFNNALVGFKSEFGNDLNYHFPWSGNRVTWENDLYPQAVNNPFLGSLPFVPPPTTTAGAMPLGCDVTLTAPTLPNCQNTAIIREFPLYYPRQCTLADLAGANVNRLRQCGLNYELHPNGTREQWPPNYQAALQPYGVFNNQYGRTSFLFAGVPGMQMPVPYYKDPSKTNSISVYEQVNNASIFSLYLPIANEADVKYAFRNYSDTEFYHTLLMSNHMESNPREFAEGVRGRTLWHNEYRTQIMYERFAAGSPLFPAVTFAGAFNPQTAPAPFHNSTCDGCHVRNGSGIPINTGYSLDKVLQTWGMSGAPYQPYQGKGDYTFTGQITPMKLVFFDLQRVTTPGDDSVYSEPLAFSARQIAQAQNAGQVAKTQYNNKIMNFYGDSFHVIRTGYKYDWYYGPVDSNRMVVSTARTNSELGKTYQPQQVNVENFDVPTSCQIAAAPPNSKAWPADCKEIDGKAIAQAITGGQVGFMLLNGKRLGNLGAIEAIPNQAIMNFQSNQVTSLGAKIAGEILWNAGTRGGVDGDRRTVCKTKSITDCYIGRFGWLGDRVSLEDQVANAAFVEMNMTTNAGYNKLYPNPSDTVMFPIRYNYPNCGQANLQCTISKGNGDLSRIGYRANGRLRTLARQSNALRVYGYAAGGYRRRGSISETAV